MADYTILVLLVLSCAAFSTTQQDYLSYSTMAEIRQEIQSCIDSAFKKYGPTLTSCKEIAENDPQASSGYYKIWSSNGSAVQVYCDMDRV